MDAEDDQRPHVELGHEDTDGHDATPEQASAADRRDDTVVAALDGCVADARRHRFVPRGRLAEPAQRHNTRRHLDHRGLTAFLVGHGFRGTGGDADGPRR